MCDAGTVCEVTGTTAYLNRYAHEGSTYLRLRHPQGVLESACLCCRYHGRTRVMQYSGILFMIAAIILACSFHIAMIFVGRVFQGVAVRPACLK